ncbi:MAG TPA: hypothetical protein VN181_06140 [Thermoanaerobaculia bacterium]|nr:hypothetical protein [Thermoanaerobaculia bacterium]
MPNRERVRALLDKLELIPHTFLRVPDLTRNEFRAAYDEFETSGAARKIDPYVDHWWETLWRHPPWIARCIQEPEYVALLDSLSLWQQIAMLIDQPDTLRFQQRHASSLQSALRDDRKMFGTQRGSTEAFVGAVKRELQRYEWPVPTRGYAEFAEFIVTRPDLCPSWRVSFAIYEEFRCNLTTIPRKNDIPDFTHVQMLAYVNHATLDKAWRIRCEQASRRFAKFGAVLPAFASVHTGLEEILTLWKRKAG